jgi:hypothetical protein
MALNWRDMKTEKPKDGQDCLVDMKHGIHEGTWSESDQSFFTYLFNDIEFNGHRWVPIEEVKQ